jgi:hypothetical protein
LSDLSGGDKCRRMTRADQPHTVELDPAPPSPSGMKFLFYPAATQPSCTLESAGVPLCPFVSYGACPSCHEVT